MLKEIIKWSFVIFALLLPSCKKDVSDYAGKYEGTLSSQDAKKDNAELLFDTDVPDENILLFSIYPLTKETDGNQYTTTDKEAILKIINMLYPDITSGMIYNTSAVFVFEKKELTMELQYGVKANDSDPLIIRFIGKRK